MPPNPTTPRRALGVTIPLFSLRTHASWGIGEIGDLVPFARWIAPAGISVVQMLPLQEISGNETSPYAALSAFGLDPMYISLRALPELATQSLAGDEARDLERARRAPRVDYATVRRLKSIALRHACARFVAGDGAPSSSHGNARRAEYEAFLAAQREWLDDYVLFRALKDAMGGTPWWKWPLALRERHAAAMDDARVRLANEIGYHRFAQWIAHAQWSEMRNGLRAMNVEVMGDLPFMVARDSADVWAHPSEFRHDANVGAPPDQFDVEGQDWGLPPYHWERMSQNDFRWLERRARYAGSLYDRFRIDHVVGLFRTFVRKIGGKIPAGRKLIPGVFDPPDESRQATHGVRVVTSMLRGASTQRSQLIAEDLGIIPDFVRPALAQLGVPGYRVLIWEKDGDVYRDPTTYPALSVACFATHDTDSVVTWWEGLTKKERAAVKAIPSWSAAARRAHESFDDSTHAALLELICSARSDLVLLLFQDVLGSRDRVNTPGTQGEHNWTLRLPANIEELASDRSATAALARVAAAARHGGRVTPSPQS